MPYSFCGHYTWSFLCCEYSPPSTPSLSISGSSSSFRAQAECQLLREALRHNPEHPAPTRILSMATMFITLKHTSEITLLVACHSASRVGGGLSFHHK